MLIDEDLLEEVLSALDKPTAVLVHGLFKDQSGGLAAQIADPGIAPSERAEAAHALKGLALQFGLVLLCALLEDLDRAGRTGDAARMDGLAQGLADLLDRSAQALGQSLARRGITA